MKGTPSLVNSEIGTIVSHDGVLTFSDLNPKARGPLAAQIFGNGAEEYCQKYGATWKHVAAIAAKNHRHSVKYVTLMGEEVFGRTLY